MLVKLGLTSICLLVHLLASVRSEVPSTGLRSGNAVVEGATVPATEATLSLSSSQENSKPATRDDDDDRTIPFVSCLAEHGVKNTVFVRRPKELGAKPVPTRPPTGTSANEVNGKRRRKRQDQNSNGNGNGNGHLPLAVERGAASAGTGKEPPHPHPDPAAALTALYNKLNHQWNSRGGTIYPLGYIVARTEAHVQAAVVCGHRLGIHLVPRSGGHGFTKYGFGDADSVIVDLERLNRVEVVYKGYKSNASHPTGLVGPGARIGEVGYLLWTQGGFMTSIGICPSVGMGGLALGGGYGIFSRLYGLTTDNILELRMVDVNGKMRTVSNETDPELFWALRGGGAVGQFGIVTQFRFKLYAVPHRIVAAVVQYEFKHFVAVFTAWHALFKLSAHLPSTFGCYLTITRFGVIRISLADVQDEAAAAAFGTDRLHRIIATLPSSVSQNVTLASFTYPEYLTVMTAVSFHGLIPPPFNVSTASDLLRLTHFEGAEFFKGKSLHISKELNADGVTAFYMQLSKIVPGIRLNFEPYGGAINEVGLSSVGTDTDNAFVHRGNVWTHVSLYIETEEEDPVLLARLAEFYEVSKAPSVLNHSQSYQNYIDDDLPDGEYLQRYFGTEALERLMKIKRVLDPDNYFSNQQSLIPRRTTRRSVTAPVQMPVQKRATIN